MNESINYYPEAVAEEYATQEADTIEALETATDDLSIMGYTIDPMYQ